MSKQYNDLLIADLHRATNSEAMDSEKNMALFHRIAAGDNAAREEMIVGNMPLAIANVESFIRRFPGTAHLRDDLTSAAFIGLSKGVNRMARGCRIRRPETWNPTEYIGTWINRELGELLEDEGVTPPHTSKWRAETQGKEVEMPTITNVIPERFEIPSYEKELEMRDLIESCCTCEEERTFVAMREAGHTLSEIGRAIGRSSPSVHRMGKKLEARVMRKLEALRDE